MKPVLAIAALLSVVVVASVARADEISEARDHFRKGSKAFDLGHYREAIKEYEAAYNIKDDPALLFNIAQAYRLDGDNENAVRAYRSFLHRMPNAPNRSEVERRIAELQKAIEQQGRAKEGPPEGTLAPGERAPTPTPTPTTPATSPSPPSPATSEPQPVAGTNTEHAGRTKKIAGLVVAGVGVAALAVGAAFGGLAVKAGNDLTQLNQNMGTFDSAKQSAGKTDQVLEGVFLGIGGAAVVAGTVVYVLGYRETKASRSRAAIAPVLAPGRVGVNAMVHF